MATYCDISYTECYRYIALGFDFYTLRFIAENAEDTLVENLASVLGSIVNASGTFRTNNLILISNIGSVQDFIDIRDL
jgi:hypothetical protein